MGDFGDWGGFDVFVDFDLGEVWCVVIEWMCVCIVVVMGYID